ncbi:hypothetical protein KC675_03665 [Candidatus Dojkabacteria bacterium]|uniref:Uncharacterized protein n=1 Tax=Candidatus Dojkabacteria bacterium TaxID=2099670 RepID=A0A955I8A7_9BACT|nr:hypothetical protein [Candidatus Dojkabacteria bacterium]
MDVIKAQSILIIPKQSSDPSVILSALVLGRTLTENGKHVSYYLDETISKSIDIFYDGEKIINDTNSRNELIVKLDKVKSTITHLDWNQDQEELTIKLISNEGEIGSPDISITHTNQNFDLRIFIQARKEDLESRSNAKDTSVFSGTSVHLLEESDINTPITVFKFIKKTKYKLSLQNSENLLIALRNSTNNFTTGISSESFLVAAELLSITEKSNQVQNAIVEEKAENENTKKPSTESKVSPVEKVDLPKETIKTDKKPIVKPEEKNFATPEELPADYDPLSPATTLPEPIKLETNKVIPQTEANSPLPQASQN